MDLWSVLERWFLVTLPLHVVRRLFPQTAGYLPLGDSHFNQNAILLMIALFICGMIKLGIVLHQGSRQTAMLVLLITAPPT